MKEQLSALMDGEIDLESHPHLYLALRNGEEAMECWATWHLIGDVMRGDPVMRTDMSARVMQALADEPVILAPRRRLRDWMSADHAVPLAATAAAVAFVGWMVWQPDVAPQRDSIRPSVAQNTLSPDMFNSYMLAHHEFAPSAGMQHAYDIRPVEYGSSGH